MDRRAVVAVAVAAAVLAAGGPALAKQQPRLRPEAGTPREGLVLGVAMGGATLKAGFDGGQFNGTGDESVATATADFQFGGMLTRRMALLFHFNLARGTDDGAVQHLQASALVGFRLFVTQVFWLEVAFGTSGYQARDTIFDATLEEHAHSVAYLLGLGIELYQSGRFTIDIRTNIGFAEYRGGFSSSFLQGLIGLNWY